jgi:class 3 adenylate cyclase
VRVERAFAFIDLSGFTGFTHRHGDHAARDVLTEFRSGVRTVVDDHGIRVAKWLGDGAMVVSVDAAALVSAVVELHDRRRRTVAALPVRSGVTLGHVIVFEGDDYIGSTVNLAARLCDQAGDDEILAHSLIVERLTGRVDATVLDARFVAGFGEAVPVARIDGISPSPRLRVEPVLGTR